MLSIKGVFPSPFRFDFPLEVMHSQEETKYTNWFTQAFALIEETTNLKNHKAITLQANIIMFFFLLKKICTCKLFSESVFHNLVSFTCADLQNPLF